jgi:hypothetical protein
MTLDELKSARTDSLQANMLQQQTKAGVLQVSRAVAYSICLRALPTNFSISQAVWQQSAR